MSVLRPLRQIAFSPTRCFAVRPVLSKLGGRHIQTGLAARVSPSWPATPSRAFSVSPRVRGEGATDVLLAQKLGEECEYEKTSASENDAEPEFLKAFNEQGIWQIENRSGADEVTLTRKFGNEEIRVMFSIADIQEGNEHDNNFEEEREEKEGGSEEEPIHSYPIRVSISIAKSSSPGSINVDTVCQDGSFILDNISYYPDATVGTSLTAEADWKRRGLYLGPQFETLDVSVQEEFEKFMEERGINESLATFIPEYAEYKEQKEYVRWLENVKKFVEL